MAMPMLQTLFAPCFALKRNSVLEMSRSRHDDSDDDSDLDWLTECLSSPVQKRIKLADCALHNSNATGAVDKTMAKASIQHMLDLLEEPVNQNSSSELVPVLRSGLASLTSAGAEVHVSTGLPGQHHEEQQTPRAELLEQAQSNCLETALGAMQKLLEAKLAGSKTMS